MTSFASTAVLEKDDNIALEQIDSNAKNGQTNYGFKDDENSSYKTDKNETSSTNKVRVRNVGGKIGGKVEDEEKAEKKTTDQKETTTNSLIRCLLLPLDLLKNFIRKRSDIIVQIIKWTLVLGYIVYMILALMRDFNDALALLIIFITVLVFTTYSFIRDHLGEDIWVKWQPHYRTIQDNIYWLKWIFIAICIGLLLTWIGIDTRKRPSQLISLAGYIIMIFGLFLSSKYPHKIWWRPVFWGFGVQMVFAMFILRTPLGYSIFSWLGFFVQTFLDFTDAGAEFVFGPNFRDHYFAFKVLPIIIYFSSFISVMYYFGAMQWLIFKIAWLMQFTLGTSATESMCAAGNIFVGQTESPLLIRPYIHDLTTSELHAVMVCGFGTIAGSVLGAYLGFGIDAVYLITACFMAAPCCLAVAKLCYPETKESKFKKTSGLVLEPTDQRNFIEAAAVGAATAIPLVLNIAANLIAFISLLAALDALLMWYGGLMGFPQLTFELICSYVFVPITFLMGIEWADCFECAELLGIKIFLNEFVAYEQLAELMENRTSGEIPREVDGQTNWISMRSEAIITYALCGFANVGSIGIMLGGLTTMCPERQGEMSSIVVRALICGIMVSVLNGAMSGFLYLPPAADCVELLNYTSYQYLIPDDVETCCTQLFQNETGILNPYQEACKCCNYNATSIDFNQTLCVGLSC